MTYISNSRYLILFFFVLLKRILTPLTITEKKRERERRAPGGGGGCTGHISVVKKIKQNIWPSTDDTHSFDNLHS